MKLFVKVAGEQLFGDCEARTFGEVKQVEELKRAQLNYSGE